MHQSVVEVGTGVCRNIKEAKEEVKQVRREMTTLAKANGLRLAALPLIPSLIGVLRRSIPTHAIRLSLTTCN
jgi:gamma-glutamyl:cysteine ligase YbdK (ATP-grasp superfamily)